MTIFLRNTEGKTRRDRIRNEMFRKEIGIRSVIIELQEELLRWVGRVESVDRTSIPRKALWFSQLHKT
jgi:hypothetical protein